MTDAIPEGENAEELFTLDEVAPRTPLRPTEDRRPAPWHKPRKQWIRSEQWGRLVGRLLDKLPLDGRSFRYLTLPGQYLLDVRFLHGICAKRGVRLRFLGFDSSRRDDPEVSLSMDEVWRLPNIDRQSVIHPDRIEELTRRSVAAKALEEFGHFDVVNLDLCDSVANREAGASGGAMDAVRHLVEWQSNHRKEPWYLFITTRADRGTVKNSVMAVLLEALSDNLRNNPAFEAAVSKAELIDRASVDGEIQSLRSAGHAKQSIVDDKYFRAFGLGFAKWLLRLAVAAWKVTLEINACYRVGDDAGNPNMVSLAFRFESKSTAIEDGMGIVPRRKTAHIETDEASLAVLFIKRISELIDVDDKLHQDTALREKMIFANADLMAEARFDRQEIIEWGRQVCWKPS